MKYPVRTMMDSDAYTCHESQTLADAIEIMVDKEVGGLIVIDENDRIVGYISDGDIMKAVAKQRTHSFFGGEATLGYYDNESFEEKVKELKSRNVMELASSKVLCVTVDQPVDEVAEILSRKKIKKMPVIEKDGTLAGVIRRSTITRHIFSLISDLSSESDSNSEKKEEGEKN